MSCATPCSPAYSAVWSTADSGIPIVGATDENIGRLGIWMRVRGAVAQSGSLANTPLPALTSRGASFVVPSSRHSRHDSAFVLRLGAGFVDDATHLTDRLAQFGRRCQP